jgi:hypothetical protein
MINRDLAKVMDQIADLLEITAEGRRRCMREVVRWHGRGEVAWPR